MKKPDFLIFNLPLIRKSVRAKFSVLQEDLIEVDDEKNTVDLTFTPTIPHCSMATLIGLSIRVKLIRSLPARFKTSVKITPGTHSQVFIKIPYL